MRQRCAKRSGASSSRDARETHSGFECVSIGGCLAWSCALGLPWRAQLRAAAYLDAFGIPILFLNLNGNNHHGWHGLAMH